MKRIILILFCATVAALLYGDRLLPAISFEAGAQGKGAAKSKYGSFTHKSHTGEIKIPGTAKTQKLDCAYCHTVTKEKQDVAAYPNTRPGNNETHSACTECHEFTGRQAVVSGVLPAMCVICHSSNVAAVPVMKKNLRGFPNPAVEVSQFGDQFSHKSHKDYLDKFNCSECHTANTEPVTILGQKFSKGEAMSSPSHPSCFTCHFDEKTVTKKSPTFALNCVGCHADLKPAKGKAPDPAVLFFKRKVVEPVAPEKPFSHEDHSSDGAVKGVSINNGVKGKISNQTKECMSCHLTAMTAEKRADFFLDPKTKAAQPAINGCADCVPVNGCLNCHQRNTSQKIEGAVKLETSRCTFCHSVPMMKAKAASGLPPASHLGLPPTPPLTIYALTASNKLASFDARTPGTLKNTVAITGLQPGETISGIDYRPANGQLYALGSTSRVYSINPATGAATAAGAAFTPPLNGKTFGVDFNPVPDRIRVVSDADQSLRLHPDTGAVGGTDTALAYAAGDPNTGKDPNVVSVAYTNNVAGTKVTTLFGIDSTLDILVRQGSPDGAPISPNSGQLFTIGKLGVDATDATGFDIASATGTAWAALTTAGAKNSSLYTINLTTGAATLAGAIGGNEIIRDIAVEAPKPATPPAAPAPAPARPAPAPETKPATPAPATPKPEPPKETPKAETKPAAPAQTAVVNTPPAPKPESATAPKPEPPKQPAASAPAAAPASAAKLPTQLKLGDPKESKVWGQDAKWGVVDFDHTTHIKPTYAERCETCHHTNKDAKVETVPKCVSCHLEPGNPKNPKSKGGDEVDVKLAYHGDPNNTSNNAGCIVCHQRFKENKPDANAPTRCAECHALKQAQLRPRWPGQKAEKLWMTAAYESWYPLRREAVTNTPNDGAESLSWFAGLKATVALWWLTGRVI
jgi:hypothetical protein